MKWRNAKNLSAEEQSTDGKNVATLRRLEVATDRLELIVRRLEDKLSRNGDQPILEGDV